MQSSFWEHTHATIVCDTHRLDVEDRDYVIVWPHTARVHLPPLIYIGTSLLSNLGIIAPRRVFLTSSKTTQQIE